MKPKLHIRDAAAGAEGDNAEVNRLFPVPSFMNYDPFVLWDDFTIQAGAGFPDHPHRGFEGITYVFNGSVEHKDNLGNESRVYPGGIQRFTAGRGIVHSEMPAADGITRGIQMWVNLPKKLKKIEPDYQQVDANDIPVTPINKGTIRNLSGEDSPLALHTPVTYQHVELETGGEYQQSIPASYRGFIYIIDGAVSIQDETLKAGQAGFYDTGTEVNIQALESASFMVCFGEPHNEPIYQHGPFVD